MIQQGTRSGDELGVRMANPKISLTRAALLAAAAVAVIVLVGVLAEVWLR
jgi:hypothetical protein